MKNNLINKIAIALSILSLFVFSFSNSANAAKNKSSADLGIVTGPGTGTYIKFGNDISRIASKNGLVVSVKESKGTIDNIKRINSSENVSLGIVQSDVLGYLKRLDGKQYSKILEDLRVIFPFYNEEVHVLAKRNISNFKDLDGKKVAVGEEGSGSWLTAMNLFAITGIKPAEVLRITPAEGVAAVIQQNADAVIFVSGKPVQLFKNLEKVASLEKEGGKILENIHFIPLNDSKMLEEYSKAEINKSDYSFVSGTVPTISVASMLVSHDFSKAESKFGKNRCENIGKLANSIRNGMPELAKSGHPKWKEVNLNVEVKNWELDSCASKAISSAKKSSDSGAKNTFEKDLLGIINQRAD